MKTSTENVAPAPFLRWAGSKRWIIKYLEQLVPEKFGAYYEPFLGSGAVFFTLGKGHNCHLSEVIEPLVGTYTAIRDSADAVAEIATSWSTDSNTYYRIRAQHFENPISQAARFLYLNRLCFNGLYRENKLGEFNVPYGRPRTTNTVAERSHLNRCADRLREAEISVSDFEPALSECTEGDLVYLDPPYVSGHRSNGFVDYNAKLFSWSDQERLARCFEELDRRGAYVILTNADHQSIRDLYVNRKILTIARRSNMSGKVASRGHSSELVVLSSRMAAEADL